MTEPRGTVGGARAIAGEAGATLDDALARFATGHRAALDAILHDVRRGLPWTRDDVRAVVGWATVDLERALRDAGTPNGGEPACPDELLGGRGVACAGDLILLEPTTEGRLAAALARHGEGPVALYLLTVPLTRARVSAGVDGSLRFREGLSALGPGILAERSRSGPFLVVVRDIEPVPCRA